MSFEATGSIVGTPRLRGVGVWLLDNLIEERARWVLWLPVLVGAGIGLYFTLTVEPPVWAGILGLALGLAGLAATWRSAALLPVGAAVFAVTLGFAAAQFQAWSAQAPVLERRLGPVMIEGRIAEIDPLPSGRRIIIEPSSIQRLAADKMPLRLRIRADRGPENLLPGDRIKVRATLLPPPSPAMPGAYDFQRRAYFDRLGAVGYAVSPLERVPGGGASSWRIAVESVRTAITDRIRTTLPGSTRAIAAAIITGETHAISPEDAEAFRNAGLAHILICAHINLHNRRP